MVSGTSRPARGRDLAEALEGGHSLNPTVWFPAMFLLGLAVFALMLAFVAVCNRV